ncbi:hypothetical protein CPAV1605_666 [seawater metagenome]|uniref:Uncharacterized protein n=1 Tax=seawater metagenome TaxID=1561972 RepID=A0A5E8CIB3_9ZZZZ
MRTFTETGRIGQARSAMDMPSAGSYSEMKKLVPMAALDMEGYQGENKFDAWLELPNENLFNKFLASADSKQKKNAGELLHKLGNHVEKGEWEPVIIVLGEVKEQMAEVLSKYQKYGSAESDMGDLTQFGGKAMPEGSMGEAQVDSEMPKRRKKKAKKAAKKKKAKKRRRRR